MPSLSNLRKSIFYLQQALRNDYNDNKELLEVLQIMADFDMRPAIISRLETIAKSYHDRDICSCVSMSVFGDGPKLNCPVCFKQVHTLTSIESDDRDFSKDMSICWDCYDKLHNIWKTNTPGKICPC
jgi:hypothetical protein